MENVLIFAGGESPNGDISQELPTPDLVVAADSGYDNAVNSGYRVDVLIGDLDSLETELIPNHVIVERYPIDKDATDLELALSRVLGEHPQRLVVVGGGGGRLDHELGVALLLASERWSSIEEIDWFSDRAWVHVIHRRRSFHGDVGATVSLIPVGGDVGGVRTRGLKWELEDETLPQGTSRGVSNEFSSPVAEVTVGEGVLLAVVPTL